MASDRRPSGLPRDRIVGSIYGTPDVYQRVGSQHDGIRRVRRRLLASTIVVAALIAAVAVFGSPTSAGGMTAMLLAPLVLFLVGAQVAVMVTKPKRRDDP